MLKRLILTAAVLAFTCTAAFCQDMAKIKEQMCFEKAGEMYDIAPELLEAIAFVESSFRINIVGTLSKNGSVDICHMQINTWWKDRLGEDAWRALEDPCYCTQVGAWILRQCIDRYGYNWNAVSCYNTGRSLETKNNGKKRAGSRYVKKIQSALKKPS